MDLTTDDLRRHHPIRRRVADRVPAFLPFREPNCTARASRQPGADTIAVTTTAIMRMPQVRRMLTLAALTAMLSSAVLSCPLCLIELDPPATMQVILIVAAAQTVLALLLAIIGIRAGRLLHDSVPSTIRAGVSSGAGRCHLLSLDPGTAEVFGSPTAGAPLGWFMRAVSRMLAVVYR